MDGNREKQMDFVLMKYSLSTIMRCKELNTIRTRFFLISMVDLSCNNNNGVE